MTYFCVVCLIFSFVRIVYLVLNNIEQRPCTTVANFHFATMNAADFGPASIGSKHFFIPMCNILRYFFFLFALEKINSSTHHVIPNQTEDVRWQQHHQIFCKQTHNFNKTNRHMCTKRRHGLLLHKQFEQPLRYWLRHQRWTQKPLKRTQRAATTATTIATNRLHTAQNTIWRKSPIRRKYKQTIYRWKLISDGVCRIFGLNQKQHIALSLAATQHLRECTNRTKRCWTANRRKKKAKQFVSSRATNKWNGCANSNGQQQQQKIGWAKFQWMNATANLNAKQMLKSNYLFAQ